MRFVSGALIFEGIDPVRISISKQETPESRPVVILTHRSIKTEVSTDARKAQFLSTIDSDQAKKNNLAVCRTDPVPDSMNQREGASMFKGFPS
jgi:hypothetical protein